MRFKRFVLYVLGSTPLFAGVSGGGLMPWEGPLSLIASSLTGPTAASIGLIGIVVAGGTLVWHHDLGQFGKTVTFVALACSIMLLAVKFISSVFGVSGGVI
jgi:type IV secretory pathway VirB2 component (pilin)